jgi:hypothetical protein
VNVCIPLLFYFFSFGTCAHTRPLRDGAPDRVFVALYPREVPHEARFKDAGREMQDNIDAMMMQKRAEMMAAKGPAVQAMLRRVMGEPPV